MDGEATKIVGALGMVALAGVFLVWVLRHIAREQEDVLQRFAAFAAHHPGLEAVMKTVSHGNPVGDALARKYPALEGSYGAVQVLVCFSPPPNASQDHSASRTLFVARPPDALPAALLIRPRSLLDAPARVLGHTPATGDAAFDRQFHIQGQHHDQVLRYLTPARRGALLRAAQHSPELSVDSRSGVMLYLDGLHSEAKVLDHGLTLASTLARELG